MLKEFKEFALKGNMIDLAVGVVIGTAFGKIVTSLVNDLIMPPLGYLIGNVDFSDLKLVLRHGADGAPAVAVNYGVFINNVVNFLIIGLCIFAVVKIINNLKRPEPAKEPVVRECPECTSSISIRARRCPFCTTAVA